jgi:orotate phosphoribosyltransferase
MESRNTRRVVRMTDTSLEAFLSLVNGSHGHYLLESGHHGSLWLDLDGLFARSRRIAPFVEALSERLRRHEPEMICGPLLGGAFLAQLVAQQLDLSFCFTERVFPDAATGMYRWRYVLPTAFHSAVSRRRIAIVDDVISAGSSLRATLADLVSHEALVVVAGALLQLGDVGMAHLERSGVPVEAVTRDDYTLLLPESCPLCAANVPLTSPSPAE